MCAHTPTAQGLWNLEQSTVKVITLATAQVILGQIM